MEKLQGINGWRIGVMAGVVAFELTFASIGADQFNKTGLAIAKYCHKYSNEKVYKECLTKNDRRLTDIAWGIGSVLDIVGLAVVATLPETLYKYDTWNNAEIRKMEEEAAYRQHLIDKVQSRYTRRMTYEPI